MAERVEPGAEQNALIGARSKGSAQGVFCDWTPDVAAGP
jgi:hypothetical protein